MAISLDRPSALSKLDAVNVILAARGVTPSATTNGKRAAVEAEETLATWSLNVQVDRTWNFNTDEKLTLTPNSDGLIYLPETLHMLKPVGKDAGLEVAERGGRLYDRYNSTFVFTATVDVKATYVFPWSDLPSPARWYIALLSAFQVGNQETPGDPSLRVSQKNLNDALSALESYDRKLGPRSLRTTNPHFNRMRGRR